jgi:hypothetical protein
LNIFLKIDLYSPVEDTFRPKNENTKLVTNYYPEENYPSPVNNKQRNVTPSVPKSQRNIYEENNSIKPNSKINGLTSESKMNGKKKF